MYLTGGRATVNCGFMSWFVSCFDQLSSLFFGCICNIKVHWYKQYCPMLGETPTSNHITEVQHVR